VSIAARHYRRSRCSPVELRDGRAAAARRRAAVAGLEALLALHEIAGERIKLTLIAPDPDSSYRTMAVAEPFALGSAQRVPLRRFTEETGAEPVRAAITGVDDAAGELRLDDGGTRAFDDVIVAPGGRAVSGVEGATTWWPGGDPEIYGGLLRDVEEGYKKSLAMVVPPGSVCPLPVHELALMTAGEAREMGHDDVAVTVVTPEHAPLCARPTASVRHHHDPDDLMSTTPEDRFCTARLPRGAARWAWSWPGPAGHRRSHSDDSYQ
jgi:hypothetical protein